MPLESVEKVSHYAEVSIMLAGSCGRKTARLPHHSFSHGGFASDTVTNIYSSRMRTNLVLVQPTGTWTNRFGWDTAERLTNVTSQAGSFTNLYAVGASFLPIKVLLPNSSYITNTYDNMARLNGT